MRYFCGSVIASEKVPTVFSTILNNKTKFILCAIMTNVLFCWPVCLVARKKDNGLFLRANFSVTNFICKTVRTRSVDRLKN